LKTEGRYINTYKAFHGSMVPNWLLIRTEVSPGAKLAYARLSQFAGRNMIAFPGLDVLAAELGVSERQLFNYVTELKEHGLLEVERRGLGRVNHYRFLNHPWIDFLREEPETSDLDRKDTSDQDQQDIATPLKRIIRRESEEELYPGFEDFWKEYPKKIDKIKTRKAWRKISPNADLRISIMGALLRQKLLPSWNKEQGQYIPHPTSWLNGRRWEDQYEVPEPEPARQGVWGKKL
jgi:hypothetical protein